jgi:hypothetical protein
MGSRAWFTLLSIFFLLALVWPLWILQYPPLQDFPTALLIAEVIANPTNPLFADYEWAGIQTPLFSLFYALVWLLTRVFEARTALAIVLSLYVVSLPMALRYAWKAVHGQTREEPWALFCLAPLVTHPFYFYGLFNFLISLPIAMVCFGLTLRTIQSSRRAGQIWLAVWLLLLVLSHPFTFILTGYLALLAVATAGKGRLRRVMGLAITAAPALIVFLVFLPLLPTTPRSDPQGESLALLDAFSRLDPRWWSIERLAYYLPRAMVPFYSDGVLRASGFGPFVLVGLAILSTGWAAWRAPGRRAAFSLSEPQRIATQSAFLLLATSLLLPFSFRSFSMLNLRGFVFTLLVVSLLLGPAFSRARWQRAVSVGFGLLFLVAHGIVHVRFDRELASLDRLIASMPERQNLLLFVTEPRSQHLRFVAALKWTPFYYHAAKGGVSPEMLFNPMFPVRYREPERWPRISREDLGAGTSDEPGNVYDGIIVVGPAPRVESKLSRRATLAAHEGLWAYWSAGAPDER